MPPTTTEKLPLIGNIYRTHFAPRMEWNRDEKEMEYVIYRWLEGDEEEPTRIVVTDDYGTVQNCHQCGLAFFSHWEPSRFNCYDVGRLEPNPEDFVCDMCQMRGAFNTNMERLEDSKPAAPKPKKAYKKPKKPRKGT